MFSASLTARCRPVVATAVAALFLPALPAFALWSPSSRWAEEPTDAHVQQLRNLRDVLNVDSYRSTPTPPQKPTLPLPAASPGKGIVVTWGNHDFEDAPFRVRHPLSDYFSVVADRYRGHAGRSGLVAVTFNFPAPDYPLVAEAIRPAGRALERLVTGKSRRRFAQARQVARRIEHAVALSPESYGYHIGWLHPDEPSSGARPDYRGLALAFASDLRFAARNAAAGRPLAGRVPLRPLPMLFIVTYDGFTGAPVKIVRTDGRGGSSATLLAPPAPPAAPDTGGVVFGNAGGFAITSSGSFEFSVEVRPAASPTP